MMTHPDVAKIKDSLNRVAKVDLDSGAAPDVDAAIARLGSYRVGVVVGPEISHSAPHQAALLTVVNVARRFALGGVTVEGDLDVPLLVMGDRTRSLADEVEALGGRRDVVPRGCPTVVVGKPPVQPDHGVAVTFEGWRGGVVPASAPRLGEETDVIPAAVLAGALAASEAFSMLRGEAEAGHRTLGLSLWRPDRTADWFNPGSDGPRLEALPDDLWVVGLGHLGQAFLWCLLMCPFTDRGKVRLVLQDTDHVTTSTDSTSILTQPRMAGAMKTRAVAGAMERHGFSTILVERPFDNAFKRRPDDPAVLVCGVDNPLARSQLEDPGFPFVVEAGIGDGHQDFRSIRLHTFPASRSAANIWKPGSNGGRPLPDAPGYRRLGEAGADACGLTQLAQTAVGAPFVGAVAGCLMLAQVLRLLTGDAPDAVVDLDLCSTRSRRVVPNIRIIPFNPGFQALAKPEPSSL